MRNKSFRLQILPVPLIFAVFLSCEQAENPTSERLVFSVETGANAPVERFPGSGQYIIQTTGEAFLLRDEDELLSDSAFAPQALTIIINHQGQLIESLLNPNGYRVKTQIELTSGDIIINHTNQAYLVINPGGDSLYAVRGEGIVSGGTEYFENISGLFYEQSTYRIDEPIGAVGQAKAEVTQISCRYELLVDF